MPAIESEKLSPADRAAEHLMLGLRLAEGVDWPHVVELTGHDPRPALKEELAPLLARGLLERDDRYLRLTPAGLPLADALTARLLAAV